jgi:Sulfotransferase domain
MALQVVGAGLGRTGTASLKQALELLLDGRCYHMLEVFEREQDIAAWHSAVRGDPVAWDAFLDEYTASVDWPASAFWRELSAANPDAIVLLSTRDSSEQWWASMERTIVPTVKGSVPADQPAVARHREMVTELFNRRFTPDWDTPAGAIAAYERHNEDVRGAADPRRLVEWRPNDGWGPICSALGMAVPDEPFPHENTTAEFRDRQGLTDA